MSRRAVDAPEAYEEYLDQADSFEAQSDGLGDRFISRLEVAIGEILDDPRGWVKAPYWDEELILYWRGVEPFRVRVVSYVDGDCESSPTLMNPARPAIGDIA